MYGFRDFSIKHKLTWITMLTSSIALILACLAFLAYDRITFRDRLVLELQLLAEVIGTNSTAALVFSNERDATETLSALRVEEHIVSAAVYRQDGTVFAKFHREGLAFTPPEPIEGTHRFGPDDLVLFEAIHLDDEAVGSIFIQSDLLQLETRQKGYAGIVVLFLVASSLIAYLITSSLQRLVSRPILQLTEVVKAVSEEGDYGARGVKESQDEVGVLIEGFNEMLTQIQERDEALQAVNDDLEDRVTRRTQDLEQVNASLRAEVAARERTQVALSESDEQLRQSQKLEAVGRLAGGVAHDFNNQLAIIRGYVDMVLDEMDEGSREYQHLGQIGKAVQRSASLTEQLLMFSSKQPVNMKPLDLNHHVEDLQKMLDRILGEDIDVELDLEEDIWTVNADSGNIDQVITNLSMNARDAMPEGGSLTIQTRNVWVDESFCLLISDARPGNFACLTVTDTGTGMSEEVLTRLFEPFFTTKAAGKGTGLGLSVVYGIVQSHEGRVTVESKLEKGSKLSLFLPTVEDEAIRTGEEPVVDLDQFRGNGEQVLLIEDEPALRAMTAQALSDNGYEVHACGTAGEATDAFRQVSFDLVLSDVGLPDGRGTDVVFGFLSEKPNLPAILVTGYTDERSEWERVQDAGLLILQKTVPMSDLLKCVHQALQTNGA